VAKIAAYIDLNPVRAGLCEDPKEYRYCGYAEALAKGTAAAMEGIRVIFTQTPTASLPKPNCGDGWLGSAQPPLVLSPFGHDRS
jgi:putative transposase